LKETNMRKILMTISLLALLISAAPVGAANPAAPLSTPELKEALAAAKKNTVVFFLNPQGGPCMAQKEILQKLLADRRNNFAVVFVSAMEPGNRQAFYDYGVRSLPSLVLVDKGGRISRVFPPGIQSYETLAAALDGPK
jgi:thioredoxin 1